MGKIKGGYYYESETGILNRKERCAVQTMISLEIRSNIDCEEMGIEPAFDTEMLKALYRKLAGFEWEKEVKK